MYRLRMGLCLLLGAALLAGCSDRNALTAPSARPLAGTATLVDRPYTWSFACHGGVVFGAQWAWAEKGAAVASGRAGCTRDQKPSGTRGRPPHPNRFPPPDGDGPQSRT